MNWKNKNGQQITRWIDYKGSNVIICKICGKKFEGFNCEKRKYCSLECYWKSHTKRPDRSNRKTALCEWCKKEFNRPASYFLKTKHHFCSNRCSSDWWAEFGLHGEDNPNWMGGYSQKEYSDGWVKLKKQVKARANGKCEICSGIHKLMDVHHKIPVRLKKDISVTNHVENLQYLCRPCHIKADLVLRRYRCQK